MRSERESRSHWVQLGTGYDGFVEELCLFALPTELVVGKETKGTQYATVAIK